MSVYLCNKCDTWHQTKKAWKDHKCGKGRKSPPAYFEKPVESEDSENVRGIVNSATDASEETHIITGKADLLKELKERGIIKDARTVKGKTEEELSEMLEAGKSEKDEKEKE